MRGIEYLLLRFGLFVFFAVVTSPVAIAAGLMMEYLDAHENVRILKWVFAPVLLVWLFGLPWLTNQAAQHMAFEGQKFGAAVRLTFYDLRLRLAFLPLVGHWFAPHPHEREHDDEDNRIRYSMNSPSNAISPEATAFVIDAIKAFSALIEDERGGALPQVLVQDMGGKRSIVVVTAGSGEPGEPVTEADVTTGRELLQKLRRTPDVVSMAALVYDSFLSLGGSRTSALVAEIIDGRTWHVLAQRYSCSGSQFSCVGRLVYLAGNSVDLNV